MREKKIFKVASMFVVMMIFAFGLMSIRSDAATNVVSLTAGKTYTSYDITGNGKKNKFKYTRPDRSTLNLYLDGKKKGSINVARGGGLYLCKASSKNVFLMATVGQFGASDCTVYIYKKGKFQCVYEYLSEFGFDYTVPYSISSTTFYAKTTVGKHFRLFALRDNKKAPSCKVKYRVLNKEIIVASQYATLSGTYKALKSFKTSSSATSRNTKGVYVKKGAKVTLKKVFFPTKYREPMIQISVGGKTGWVGSYGDQKLNTYYALT